MAEGLEIRAVDDAIEAAADALLTACGAGVYLRTGVPPTIEASVKLATRALARIVARTEREGARER